MHGNCMDSLTCGIGTYCMSLTCNSRALTETQYADVVEMYAQLWGCMCIHDSKFYTPLLGTDDVSDDLVVAGPMHNGVDGLYDCHKL